MATAERVAKAIGIGTTGLRGLRFGDRPFLRLAHVEPVARRRPLGWYLLAAVAAPVAMMVMRRRRQQSRVEDVMVKDVVTIDASATLTEAAQRMRDANVGILPVVAEGQVRGVITDRDLAVRAMARGLDPSHARVSDFAREEPVCARPDWSVDRAMRAMADAQIGRLPVADGNNRIVGIVTLSSVALRSREEKEALDTAQQVSRRSSRG